MPLLDERPSPTKVAKVLYLQPQPGGPRVARADVRCRPHVMVNGAEVQGQLHCLSTTQSETIRSGSRLFSKFSGVDTAAEAFIRSRNGLASLFYETAERLSEYFELADCELSVDYDPEEPAVVQLVIGVRVKQHEVETETFERFLEDWWFENCARAGGALAVMLRL